MNEPIRILNLFTIMNRGGAETMVMNYYRAIDKSKIQFDFMVHRQERGAYDDEIEAMGGRIFRMCPIYPQNLFKYQQLLKTFFDNHPEYRILHSHMSELGYFAFKEAIKHGVPVRICHAHNAPVFSSETAIEKLKRIPRELLARQMRKLSTDYFTCSQIAGEWLFGKKNREKLIFMRNAIDTAAFAYNEATSQKVKAEFGWNNKYVIGHVGRFCPQKNHDFLIDIFHEFHTKHPESVLALVGSGELQGVIQEKVKHLGLEKDVCFLGNRADMPLLYQAFDVFLFPSFYEGLPVSLIEAQASGLPCVLSDTISDQTRLIPTYYPVSIKEKPELWVTQLEKCMDIPHADTTSMIQKAGFDINNNAEWLTNFYLNKLS